MNFSSQWETEMSKKRAFAFLLMSWTLSGGTLATGGQFGVEFAIDAPWRLEPVTNPDSSLTYGPISIVVVFHDAVFEASRSRLEGHGLPKIPIGEFQEVRVVEWTQDQPHPRHPVTTFLPAQLREIERRPLVSTKTREPDHELCRPSPGRDCSSLLDITRSHDWQAVFWYTPKAAVTPGRNIHLEVTAVTGRGRYRREWKNYLVVHAGEAPLPRFGDTWLYGDLHYHSEMTDNEGESAYGYRNVSRALGAMGVDFVFATDHASNGTQLVDGKIEREFCADAQGETCTEARDLNVNRYAAGKTELYGPDGVNEAIVRELEVNGVARARSANVLPQVYMGEEVDAIPEMSSAEFNGGNVLFGHGLRYAWPNVSNCLASSSSDACKQKYSAPSAPRDHRSYLVLDEQGIPLHETIDDEVENETARDILKFITPDLTEVHATRQHIVYFPSNALPNTQGWVASNTGPFGGGGKRLHDVLNEIQAGGFAFLAHPIESHQPGSPAGPDIVPYSSIALDRAWRSPAILGLQLWNENDFVVSSPNRLSPTVVFETRDGLTTRYSFNWPFQGHTYGNFPWKWQRYASLARVRDLYHGAFTWDRYLRKGLNPGETRTISWLQPGEPRKWFMAGGSDAHGDWNYRRKGRPCANRWCDVPITDAAIANPRNLVSMVRPSTGVVDPPTATDRIGERATGPKRYSNVEVLGALRSGAFSVTDGPAIRIAFDRNNNGIVDDGDLPMGSTLDYFAGDHIPVLIEWISTPEFGPLAAIDVYIGNPTTTFAPSDVRPAGITAAGDGYAADPSNTLKIRLADEFGRTVVTQAARIGYRGVAKLFIGPAQFRLAGNDSALSYVRAVAKTIAAGQASDLGLCAGAWAAGSKCGSRLAYSNPVWARYRATCPPSRRRPEVAIGGPTNFVDGNGNLMPDACERSLPDPCATRPGRVRETPPLGRGQPPRASDSTRGAPVTPPRWPIPDRSCQTIRAL